MRDAGAGGERERGIALVLTFLVILILVVVAGEISLTSAVEREIAGRQLEEMRTEFAARGAVEVAKALLVRDVREGLREATGTRTLLPAAAPGLASFAAVRDFKDTQAAEAASEAGAAPRYAGFQPAPRTRQVDSFLDAWADPEACHRTFADDLDVTIRIVDEDSKINLLWLIAEDARLQDLWKDRVEHLLDLFREGTLHDLSLADAERLADGIEDYLRGRRGRGFPQPCLSTMTRQQKMAVFGRERFAVDDPDGPVHFPLGLDELLAVPDLTPHLLDGFRERGRYVPGLRDVATVFTSLLYDPDDVTGQEPYVWPFMKRQKEWQRREKIRQEAKNAAVASQVLESGAGRINVNTAPQSVLRALARMAGLSSFAVTALDELRPMRGADWETVEPFLGDVGILARLEADNAPLYGLHPEDRADFENALCTGSHVFTVLVRIQKTTDHQPRSGYVTSYRTVLWRRTDSGGTVHTTPLVPFHRWSHPVEDVVRHETLSSLT